MTYYEEFGVRQDASVEEIRKAYKLLVRILHPDTQRDSKLKALAECQMKRLGELTAILGNPQLRRKYDDSLLLANRLQLRRVAAVETREVPTWMSGVWGQFTVSYGLFLMLMGLLLVALGLWNATRSDSDDGSLSATPRLDTTVEEPDRQPVHITRTPRTDHIRSSAPVGPRTRVHVVRKVPPVTPRKPPEHSSGPAFKDVSPPNSITASPNQTAPASPPRQPSLAGRWLYSPAVSEAAEPGQYAAKFVELSLTESDGKLLGAYRAQYKIPDRAMSSEVAFQAIGPIAASGTSATLSWTSRAGAIGIAKLILQSPNVMHLAWWTTQFGSQTTLASGTALLIRQQAP